MTWDGYVLSLANGGDFIRRVSHRVSGGGLIPAWYHMSVECREMSQMRVSFLFLGGGGGGGGGGAAKIFHSPWLEIVFTLRGTNSKTDNTLSPVICFWLNSLKSTAKTPAVRPNSLRDTKTAILTTQ